jgi:tetratricopeptide (TPR) repeat protein
VQVEMQSAAPESIGSRLRRLRVERALSQRELSEPGVSYAYISRIEAGTRQPSVKALRVLARRLAVSVEYLETGREVGDEAERELRISDAELRLRLDDNAEGTADELRALLELAEQAGDRLGAQRAAGALGIAAFRAGRAQDAIGHLEAALAAPAPPPAARPDLYATLGQAYALAGRPERAVELFRQCIAELERYAPDDAGTHVRFSIHLGYALADVGDLGGAQGAVREALVHAEAAADPYARVRLHWSLARLAELDGRSAAALGHIRRAIALLESSDDTLHLARAHVLCARLLMLPGGDLDDAANELERAQVLFGPRGAVNDLASLRTERARHAALRDDGDEAVRLAGDALDLLGPDAPAEQGQAWWVLAAGHALLGRIDEADQSFRRAADLLSEHGPARDRAEVHRAWGYALASAGREAAAAEAFGRAER